MAEVPVTPVATAASLDDVQLSEGDASGSNSKVKNSSTDNDNVRRAILVANEVAADEADAAGKVELDDTPAQKGPAVNPETGESGSWIWEEGKKVFVPDEAAVRRVGQ